MSKLSRKPCHLEVNSGKPSRCAGTTAFPENFFSASEAERVWLRHAKSITCGDGPTNRGVRQRRRLSDAALGYTRSIGARHFRSGPVWRQDLHGASSGAGAYGQAIGRVFGNVLASDAFAYGFGTVADFLTAPVEAKSADWVITNPPFRLGEQFIQRSLIVARAGVAMLTRTVFIESVGRYRNMFEANPPSRFAQFSERVPMVKGRLDPRASTATLGLGLFGNAWWHESVFNARCLLQEGAGAGLRLTEAVHPLGYLSARQLDFRLTKLALMQPVHPFEERRRKACSAASRDHASPLGTWPP